MGISCSFLFYNLSSVPVCLGSSHPPVIEYAQNKEGIFSGKDRANVGHFRFSRANVLQMYSPCDFLFASLDYETI